MKKYIVHTDGSVMKNQNIGGWGCIIECITPGFENKVEFNGVDHGDYITSTKMELVAVLNAIQHIPKNSDITLYTDSKHIVFGAERGIDIWPQNQWISRQDNFIKLKQLWEEFIVMTKKYEKLSIQWVKGHSDNHNNLRADSLAKMATRGQLISPYKLNKTFSVFIHFSRIPKTKNDFKWVFRIHNNDINYEEKQVEFNGDWHDINKKITQKITQFLKDKDYHFAHIYSDSKNFHNSFEKSLDKFNFMHIKDKKMHPEQIKRFNHCKKQVKKNKPKAL